MTISSSSKITVATNFYYDIVCSDKDEAIEFAFKLQPAVLQVFKNLSLVFSAVYSAGKEGCEPENWKDTKAIVKWSQDVKAVMVPDTGASVEEGKVKDTWGLISMLNDIINAFSDPVEARASSPAEFEKDADSDSPTPATPTVKVSDNLEKKSVKTNSFYENFKRFIIPVIPICIINPTK